MSQTLIPTYESFEQMHVGSAHLTHPRASRHFLRHVATALGFQKGGLRSLRRLAVLLVCLFLAASLVPLGSAQTVQQPGAPLPPMPPLPSLPPAPSYSFGCELSLDYQRCLGVADFSVTGHTDSVKDQGDFFLRAILTNDGPASRMVWVEFLAHWSQADGDQTRVDINQGYHKLPAEGSVVVATDWTTDLSEQGGNLSFLVRAQLLTSYGMTNNWKTGEVTDWHEASFSLKPVWNVTEPLEANMTSLLATAELEHVRGGVSPVNLSLVHSGKDWSFTAEAIEGVLEAGENTTVQVHVRPPVDASEGDRARAVLMVEDPDLPSSVPGFLRFETPPVNGSSLGPDPSVNGTADATKSGVEETGKERWAVAIGLAEEHINKSGELVLGSIPDDEPSAPDAPDMPDAPDGLSNPQDKSGEEWFWYFADTTVDTYNDLADQWPENPFPDTRPMIGVGLNQLERHSPEWMNPPNLNLRSPNSMTKSPLPAGESIFVGPPVHEGTTLTASAAQGEGYTWTERSFTSWSQGSIDGSETNGAPPAVHEPDPGNSGSKSPDGEPDGRTPLSTIASEVVPLPFNPVLGAVVLVGFAGGALLGTALARPESLFARWFGKILSSLGLAKLFSRTTGPDVLKNPLRAQIHDVIANEPGITISALVTRTGVNRSTLRHHLRTLEREKLIQSHSKGKACHFYPKGHARGGPQLLARDSLFYRHRSRLAKAILEDPGQVQKQLAQRVDLPPSRVHSYTRSLADAGLIRMEHEGRFCRYFPTESLRSFEESELTTV